MASKKNEIRDDDLEEWEEELKFYDDYKAWQTWWEDKKSIWEPCMSMD